MIHFVCAGVWARGCCVGTDSCWDANDRPNLSSILLCRGWSPKLNSWKTINREKRAKGQFLSSLYNGDRTGCVRRSGGGVGSRDMFWAESRRAAEAGGMKAPRRPRQTRLLPRFCVCAVGLLAAAWIFNFNDVTGAFQGNYTCKCRDFIYSKHIRVLSMTMQFTLFKC